MLKLLKRNRQKLASQPEDEPRIYMLGGGWGNRIEWDDVRALEVKGWKPVLPREGDFLLTPMASGKVGKYRFTQVRYETDPRDMFWGTVEPVGYYEVDWEECKEELGSGVHFLV